MSESVEREVLLPVPVEEAWEAVTEPEELEEWRLERQDYPGEVVTNLR